ncbi:tetratricopeptide repeat protein [Tautonia plasticadhaerens]|uniref:Tetratricopeptide repeat protein n=1 Tax=Tautonia plasticadhaerens TaxID=2527974 RepID=A0A518H6E8_9BACT|nr:tetratricopeptide repeat protein [Tautonia plasticadhaerens]QDV36413.1 hypothetical protein ElP_43370 [Tautonia plasticadhaerens]
MSGDHDDLDAEVRRLLGEGDDLLEEDRSEGALARYHAAWERLPEPRTDHPVALDILAADGNSHFFRSDYAAARDALMTAMTFGGAVDNPYLRLRLGQCLFEAGDEREAANWLAGAYLLEGSKLFVDEDPKYLEFIRSQLQPPPGGWPEGW